jgi:GNAT superfamily N-acetyltransferase
MRTRPMADGDLDAVAALCGQLGYPAPAAQIGRRVDRIARDPDAALFVAEADGGRVVGWVYVRSVLLMEHDPCAEVWGLVVDANARRAGAGRALMARAEEWACGQGYTELRLRSSVARAGAHAFYRCLGYEVVATSHMFRKGLVG